MSLWDNKSAKKCHVSFDWPSKPNSVILLQLLPVISIIIYKFDFFIRSNNVSNPYATDIATAYK